MTFDSRYYYYIIVAVTVETLLITPIDGVSDTCMLCLGVIIHPTRFPQGDIVSRERPHFRFSFPFRRCLFSFNYENMAPAPALTARDDKTKPRGIQRSTDTYVALMRLENSTVHCG